jgi:hypothetical protein
MHEMEKARQTLGFIDRIEHTSLLANTCRTAKKLEPRKLSG